MTESRSTFDALKSISTDSIPYSTSVSLTEMLIVGGVVSTVKFRVSLVFALVASSQQVTFQLWLPSANP